MARFGRFLLAGILIFLSLGLPAPRPVGAAAAAAPFTLALTTTAGGSATATPQSPTYSAGTIVTIAATPAAGYLFVGWVIDGAAGGWANPRKLVMDADHTVVATFAPLIAFTDLPGSGAESDAIRQMSVRGVIKGYTPAGCAARGRGAPCFGPQDTVLRGEIAVMVVRALGWDGLAPAAAAPFSDLASIDPELQRAIAILAERGVMRGYGDGRAGPTDPVLRIQIISLITRAMIEAGYWVAATTDDPTLYPNIPASSAHRLDLVTFVRNAGPIPDRPQNQPWADWLTPAPRAWTARVLWQALNSYFAGGPYNPNPTNSPPTATAEAYTIAEGTPLLVAAPGVLGNDNDPNGDALTAVLGTGPIHAASFALAANGSFSYTPVTGYIGPDSFTYQARDPNGALSATTTAAITVAAGEPAPTVTTTSPVTGATNVAANADLAITFSEPVAVAGAWFQIVCGTSGAHPAAVTGGPTAFVLNPAVDFAPGETCTVTIVASQVTDTDTNDPFDAMAANFAFSFTVEAPPAVTTTVPANGAGSVANNTDLTITFSEPVTVAGAWFDITCTLSGAHPAAVTGGPTTYTLNPTTDFDPADSCTVTIVAALVADADAADPPDQMATNYLFSFGADVPPTVASTTPANAATGVATNTTIVVTFSEPVVVPSAATFSVECPAPDMMGFTVTAPANFPAASTSFTITPASLLPAGTTCTVTVFAAQVADADAEDPPDTMAADYTFAFTTDAAPTVLSTTPANGASAAPGTDLTVTFSEPVNVTGNWFTIACTVSGAHTAVVSGGPTTWTLNPDADFTSGESCTVTIVAAQVTDLDTAEPPDAMAANYAFTFTADAAPTVSGTTPANGATGVATNTTIVVTFSESVTATTSSFTLECPTGAAQVFTVGGSGTAVITLTPSALLPAGIVCTVTVVAAQVTDTDGAPDTMAANYVFTFSTDSAPTVSGTTPANGAANVATDATITVNFSESVTVQSAAAFSVECPVGTPIGFTVTAPAVLPAASTSFTLTPAAPLPAGSACTVTVFAAQIADADANDPPDNMTADYVFAFTTDAAPTVTSTTPADAAANVATDATIAVTFSEAVTATGASFTLACPVGTPVPFTVGGSGTATVTLTPTTALPVGASCTVTVVAAQVADVDGNDPPDTMAANYAFTFTVDSPPTVLTTTPANGATGVATNATITVNFSESVNATTSSFTLECPAGTPIAFTLGASPAASFTLTPDAPLPAGTTCAVTVLAAGIGDADSGDPPDNLAANYVFSFSVPPVANADSYAQQIIGNVGVNTANSSGFNLLTNDVGAGLTINAPTATANGGTLLVATGGTFTYTPPRGYTGADSFTYTVSNAAGTSAPATVSLTTISGMVWFIDNNAAACGTTCGTLATPYPTLAAFNTANAGAGGLDPDNGDAIFFYQSATGYTGPLALRANQHLIGQDAGAPLETLAALPASSDSFPLPAMDPAAPAATIGGSGITLGSGNQLHGFTVSTTTGTAITGSAFGTLTVSTVVVSATGGGALSLTTGTLTGSFTSLTSTGGVNNVLLAGVTASGTVALGAGALSGASAQGFSLTGATSGAFTYSGTIAGGGGAAVGIAGGTASATLSGNVSQANSAALVSVSGGHATGTVAFSGTLSATNGTGLQFDNADGTYTFTGATTLNGGDAGIDILNDSGGIFNLGAATITNPTGIAFRFGGGGATVSHSGSITKSSGGLLVEITGHTGVNAITLSGALSATGASGGISVTGNTGGAITFSNASKVLTTGANTAVNLATNTGATIGFTNGGLAITTTTGNGFSATGGGTVTVTGTNTIASTGGVALNVANTTIGASGLTFQSISANGGASGIVLNTTGATAGLTVAGTGAANSGGTIQNTTGPGISLTNTRDVALTRMNIQSTGGSGVQGTTVTNFSFTNGTINNSGPGVTDASNIAFHALDATNLTGTVTITGNTLTNAYYHGVDIVNYNGTISSATISNNTITSGTTSGAGGTSFGSGIRFVASGTASTAANVTAATLATNTITNFPGGAGIVAQGGNANTSGGAPQGTFGTPGNAANIIAITGNTIQGQSAANKMGTNAILAKGDGRVQANFNIANNNLTNIAGNVISHTPTGVGTVTSTITGNTIVANHQADFGGPLGISIGAGITSGLAGTMTLTTTINGNNVSQTDGPGIIGSANGGTAVLNATITNNTVAAPLGTGFSNGIEVRSGASTATNNTVCLSISGNTSAGESGGGGQPGIGVRKQGTVAGTHTFGIVGLSPSPANQAQVVSHINSANPAGGGTLVIAGDNFVSCTIP